MSLLNEPENVGTEEPLPPTLPSGAAAPPTLVPPPIVEAPSAPAEPEVQEDLWVQCDDCSQYRNVRVQLDPKKTSVTCQDMERSCFEYCDYCSDYAAQLAEHRRTRPGAREVPGIDACDCKLSVFLRDLREGSALPRQWAHWKKCDICDINRPVPCAFEEGTELQCNDINRSCDEPCDLCRRVECLCGAGQGGGGRGDDDEDEEISDEEYVESEEDSDGGPKRGGKGRTAKAARGSARGAPARGNAGKRRRAYDEDDDEDVGYARPRGGAGRRQSSRARKSRRVGDDFVGLDDLSD